MAVQLRTRRQAAARRACVKAALKYALLHATASAVLLVRPPGLPFRLFVLNLFGLAVNATGAMQLARVQGPVSLAHSDV